MPVSVLRAWFVACPGGAVVALDAGRTRQLLVADRWPSAPTRAAIGDAPEERAERVSLPTNGCVQNASKYAGKDAQKPISRMASSHQERHG